jgi:hypothetical protein
MHPHLEARATTIAQTRALCENVLENLDLVIAQLLILREIIPVESLIAKFRTDRAHLAEGEISPQEMSGFAGRLTAEFSLISNRILKPFPTGLAAIERKHAGAQ